MTHRTPPGKRESGTLWAARLRPQENRPESDRLLASTTPKAAAAWRVLLIGAHTPDLV